MIGCTVIKKKQKNKAPHRPPTGCLITNLSQRFDKSIPKHLRFGCYEDISKIQRKGKGGLKVEERNKSKGWWKQASSGPQLRGQSEGSVALPTVGTQLERNVDAETPTIGALPRTSHPAALSLFLPKTQQ